MRVERRHGKIVLARLRPLPCRLFSTWIP
jgi:hypothetical protein